MKVSPSANPGSKSRVAKLLLAVGSILIVLGIAEYAMRVVMCREANCDDFALVRERCLGNPLAVFPKDELALDRSRGLVPGTVINDRIHINHLGFRGNETTIAKPPDTLRIVCLGGSVVFGDGSTSDQTTWPAQLKTIAGKNGSPNVEVLNGGVPSFIVNSSTRRLEGLFVKMTPDVAILYNEHNDMLRRRISRLDYDPRSEVPVTVDNAFERLLARSALYLRFRAMRTHQMKVEKVARAVERTDQVSPRASDSGNPPNAAAVTHERRVQQALELESRTGSGGARYYVQKDLDDYRAEVERFVQVCRTNGIVPVLATEALAFRLDDDSATFEAEGGILVSYFPDFAGFVEMYEAYSNVLRSVARDHDLILLDAVEKMPRADGLFSDHVHYTDSGARAWAQIVEKELREAGIFDRKPRE